MGDGELLRFTLGRNRVTARMPNLLDYMLVKSQTRRAHMRGPLVLDPARGDLTGLLSRQAQDLSRRLRETAYVKKNAYDEAYAAIFESGRELVVGQAEYGPQHYARFWELFNAVGILTDGREHTRVLEFGASEFTALYRRLYPDIYLEVSDRPTPPGYIGFTREVVERIAQPEAYHVIDLEGGAAAIDESDLEPGVYDLIVFAEVLEHLDVHPVELVEALMGRLKPNGYLYLTTPNFFRRENLRKIARLEHPQPWFPPREGNWDAHHHHREYAPRELIQITREAGGEVAAFYYSDCWETEPDVPTVELGSLVMVAQPADPYRGDRSQRDTESAMS